MVAATFLAGQRNLTCIFFICLLNHPVKEEKNVSLFPCGWFIILPIKQLPCAGTQASPRGSVVNRAALASVPTEHCLRRTADVQQMKNNTPQNGYNGYKRGLQVRKPNPKGIKGFNGSNDSWFGCGNVTQNPYPLTLDRTLDWSRKAITPTVL